MHQALKDELCASELRAVDRGKLRGIASKSNTGGDYFEHQHAHIENSKLGAKAHQAKAGDADSNMLRLGTDYQGHQGRLTTSSSSADRWHMQGVHQHRSKVATPGWDVGPHQEGASSLRLSSSSANHLSISKAADCKKASMQDSPHDKAREHFEKMEASVKSSVCRHKAEGVQGV